MRCFVFFWLFAFPALLWGEVAPSEVVVLANSNTPSSVELARHYMQGRGIPRENLISLPLPADEEISWDEFSKKLWNPLLYALIQKRWLSGVPSASPDFSGRIRLADGKNKIGYLVLCRGVPLRIREAGELNTPMPVHLPTHYGTSTASVDSELTVLAFEKTDAGFIVTNPLFKANGIGDFDREKIVCVSRLDGPSLDACRALVDNALSAEKNGIAGRAYVDTGGGTTPNGDRMLESAAEVLEKSGFDISRETSPLLFDFDRRADGAVFYLGWYAKNAAGRFGDADFRFLPGAIAIHIHSVSAETLRSEAQGWAGPFVARGATVTLGNVAEPFLHLTTDPGLFVTGLSCGLQAGEAYMCATPVLSWQNILVGDPLYKPFKVSIDGQLAELKKNPGALPAELRDYILIRKANLLLKDGRKAEAQSLLAGAAREKPSPALSFALARTANYPSLAWNADTGTDMSRTDVGLLVEIACYLRDNAVNAEALALFNIVLQHPRLPARVRAKLLPLAIATAEDSGALSLAKKWREQL